MKKCPDKKCRWHKRWDNERTYGQVLTEDLCSVGWRSLKYCHFCGLYLEEKKESALDEYIKTVNKESPKYKSALEEIKERLERLEK